MSRYLWLLLVAVLLLVGTGVTISWLGKPRRMAEQFIGNLYSERYDDAARMLHAPSSLIVETDGSLTLVDKNGNSTSVPSEKLPFIASDMDSHEHDFAVTALGPSTNGILHSPPVTLYLKRVGGEVSIEAIEE